MHNNWCTTDEPYTFHAAILSISHEFWPSYVTGWWMRCHHVNTPPCCVRRTSTAWTSSLKNYKCVRAGIMLSYGIAGCCRMLWLLLDATGRCWMSLELLGVIGCCWVLLDIVGCHWMLMDALPVDGCHWMLLDVVDDSCTHMCCCWMSLDVVGCHWLLLDVVGCC